MDILDIKTLKQVALLFFFLFFVGVVAWSFLGHRARRFQDTDARLPLEEGQVVDTTLTDSAKEVRHV